MARRNHKLEMSADTGQALLEVVTVHQREQFNIRLQLPEKGLREPGIAEASGRSKTM